MSRRPRDPREEWGKWGMGHRHLAFFGALCRAPRFPLAVSFGSRSTCCDVRIPVRSGRSTRRSPPSPRSSIFPPPRWFPLPPVLKHPPVSLPLPAPLPSLHSPTHHRLPPGSPAFPPARPLPCPRARALACALAPAPAPASRFGVRAVPSLTFCSSALSWLSIGERRGFMTPGSPGDAPGTLSARENSGLVGTLSFAATRRRAFWRRKRSLGSPASVCASR